MSLIKQNYQLFINNISIPMNKLHNYMKQLDKLLEQYFWDVYFIVLFLNLLITALLILTALKLH